MRATSNPIPSAREGPASGRTQRKECAVVIRRVGALSCAKIAGLVYLILGFVFGACISLFAMTGSFAGGSDGRLPFFFGSAAIVALPIFYGVLGFVGTLLMASLFNLVAGITGGVEVDAS
jgi:hypothetical protein